MNRETLRALGLSEEQIEAVIADHARGIQAVQTRLTAAETRATELEQQLENASNSEEIQQLTQRAEAAEGQVTDLQGQLTQINVDNLVNTALTTAGATDLEYARFKLGNVELSEDGKSIVDIDNKIKDLQTQIPTYFQTTDPEGDKGGNQSQNSLNGFQQINPNLGNGSQSEPNQVQDMIDAMTSDIPAPPTK